MANDADYRRGLADAVVKIAAARFWRHVRIEDIGKAAGLTGAEVQEAVKRFRVPARTVTPMPAPAPRPPTRTRTERRPDVPPGHKWCSRGQHAVPVADMGQNRSRPDGLSDTCRACWREYWRERRAGVRTATG